MQQQQRLPGMHISCFILAAAGASALGCGSEHFLGDLSPVDLSDPPEGPTATAHSGEDFTVSPLLDPPDVTIRGESFFEDQVASVGDVDGDGYADFATLGSDSTTESRYLHLRYGGPRPVDAGGRLELSEGGVRLTLPEDFLYRESIAGVGDVDADGYSDFLILHGYCNPAREGEGAFLVYGGPRLEGVHRLSDASVFLKSSRQVTGLTRVGGYCTGSALPEWGLAGGLGDFDGDGFDDFILTAPQYVMRDYWPEVGPTVDSTGYLFYGRSERIPNGTPWQSAADARLNAPQTLFLTPTGDANGDGLADVILGDDPGDAASDRAQNWWDVRPPPGVYWLPGSTERLSGDVDLAALATPVPPATAVGDLDGDGVKDVLAYDDAGQPHLFYGGPGLFENGVDFSRAAATFEGVQRLARGPVNLVRLNDRDGDGDDELAVTRILDGYTYPWPPETLALLSGSATRQSGVIGVMPTGNPIPGASLLEGIFPLGDLDGDGIGDVLTRSGFYVPAPDPEENWVRSQYSACQLHIHYGKPGSPEAPLR